MACNCTGACLHGGGCGAGRWYPGWAPPYPPSFPQYPPTSPPLVPGKADVGLTEEDVRRILREELERAKDRG